MGRPAGWVAARTGTAGDAVAGSAAGRAAGASAAVLGGDRAGLTSEDAAVEAGVSPAGRDPVVPRGWRHAAVELGSASRAATCRSPSGRRSRSCTRRTSACARSPGGSAGRRRRSRGSCGATPRPAAASSSTGRRSRSGRPSGGPAAEDREAGRQRAAARLRAGPARRRDPRAGRRPRAGPATPRGTAAARPPAATGAGRRSWSPEQIANRLRLDFPDDESMRISHEAIYQALYVQGRGALKRELVACLRTGRALRVPGPRPARPRGSVTPEVMISERPAEAEDRAVPGHWEGDLIIGLERSAIGTLVERTTRFTMLLHLPRDGRPRHPAADQERPALWPATAPKRQGRDRRRRSTTLPEQLRRSLTWDRGKEMAQHAQLHDRHRHRGLLLPTRTAPGSAARTRTPTACCASTSRRAPTCPARPPTSSTPSPPPSTAGPARPSAGRPRRSPQRTPTVGRTRRCCDDPLNPVCASR